MVTETLLIVRATGRIVASTFEANTDGRSASSTHYWNTSATGKSTESTAIEETDECRLYCCITYSIIGGILCLLGLIGNLLSFIVFCQDKIKTSTSFLFQGLSVIDSLLLVTAIPLYGIYHYVDYVDNVAHLGYDNVYQYVLVYVLPFAYIAQTATIWVTVLVCVNRFIAVCRPYQACRLCTVHQAKIQLGFVLGFAVLYNLPKFFQARVQLSLADDGETLLIAANYTELGDNRYYQIIYSNVFYMLFLLSLPMLILTALTIRLVNALKELSRKRAGMQTARQQHDNNITLVLIVVVLVFILCQVPALVTQILWNALSNTSRTCGGFQYYFSPISNVLVLLNSAVNFPIYFLFNIRFRQVFHENFLFCAGSRRLAGGGATWSRGNSRYIGPSGDDNCNGNDNGNGNDDDGNSYATKTVTRCNRIMQVTGRATNGNNATEETFL